MLRYLQKDPENGSLFSRKWEFVFSCVTCGVTCLFPCVKWGWQACTTPTVRGIFSFAVFFSVSRPFCRFTLDFEGHFVLCCKEKLQPLIRSCYGILRGHRSAWFPLWSACRFVEFDTSIICHVLVYWFGSFLLQDMSLSLQIFAFEGQNMTLWMCCLLAFWIVTPGPAMIRIVCKYIRQIEHWIDWTNATNRRSRVGLSTPFYTLRKTRWQFHNLLKKQTPIFEKQTPIFEKTNSHFRKIKLPFSKKTNSHFRKKTNSHFRKKKKLPFSKTTNSHFWKNKLPFSKNKLPFS